MRMKKKKRLYNATLNILSKRDKIKNGVINTILGKLNAHKSLKSGL